MATKTKDLLQRVLAQKKALRAKYDALRTAPQQTASAAQGDMGFDPAMFQEMFSDPGFMQQMFGGGQQGYGFDPYGGMYSDPGFMQGGYGGNFDPYFGQYSGMGYNIDPYFGQPTNFYSAAPQAAQNANPTNDQYTYVYGQDAPTVDPQAVAQAQAAQAQQVDAAGRSSVWDAYANTNWQQKSATDPGGQNQMLSQLKMMWDAGQQPPPGFQVPQAWIDERNQKQAALAAAQKQTPQQQQAAARMQTQRGLAGQLMQSAMQRNFSNGTGPAGSGYASALQNAAGQPGGSNAWSQDQYGKAFSAMQNDPRYKQWGFDKYDWANDPTYGSAYKQYAQKAPAPPPAQPSQPANAVKPATQTVQRPGNFSQNPMAGRTQNQRRYY